MAFYIAGTLDQAEMIAVYTHCSACTDGIQTSDVIPADMSTDAMPSNNADIIDSVSPHIPASIAQTAHKDFAAARWGKFISQQVDKTEESEA